MVPDLDRQPQRRAPGGLSGIRIAHVNNIANVAWTLAQAQRRLGHEAIVVTLQASAYGLPEDLRIPSVPGPLGWNVSMFSRWRTFADFDVVHVHGGIWRSQLFYPLFKRRHRWKTLAVHFHGSETRTGKGLHHLGSIDVKFRSTPDLARWVPASLWIPNPIELPVLPPEPENPVPRFGHFPTRPDQKGTARILEVFRSVFGPGEESLRDGIRIFRGSEAELWIVTGRPHDEALKIMSRCDAVIDQISPYESYGMVGIEGMAFAKPVFSTLRLESFPDCPVLPLEADETAEHLRSVARDRDFRRKRGAAARAYVERVHDSANVARLVLRAYYESQRLPAFTSSQAASYWRRRGASYAGEIESRKLAPVYAAQTEEILDRLGDLSFSSVLEVGCGFGRIGSAVIERYGKPWVGLDLSRAQLVEARRRGDRLRPHLVEGSATSLPLRNESFDLVLAVEMLMHIPPEHVRRALGELLRVSRRHVVHVDWFEDYLAGFQTGWCWVHDYSRLWTELGATATVIPLESERLQRAFVISRVLQSTKTNSSGPGPAARLTAPAS